MKLKKVILGITFFAGILASGNFLKQNEDYNFAKANLGLCAGYALASAFDASEENAQLAGNIAAMGGAGYFGALGMEWGATIGCVGGPLGAGIGAVAGGL